MKNRLALAEHFKNSGYKTGAEVGVLGGTYSISLCEANPNLKLFCIDSWGIGETRKQEYHERKYKEAQTRLAKYNVEIIRKLSLDAVKDFDNESLDFVYIDASHKFDFVMQDIIEWSKRVRRGGIVSGHDYMDTALGVKTAVDAYVKAHQIKLFVTRDIDKNARSWYWIK